MFNVRLPVCLLSYLATILLVPVAAGQQQWQFSDEVAPLVHRWWQEDYAAVQADATQLIRTSRDPRIRREAEVVSALCLLMRPVRGDITAGRSIIAQTSQIDPMILNAPAVEYALARGHIALAETTAGLTKLIALEKRFAATPDDPRLAAILTAQAEAWVVHNEWESTPAPGITPDTPAEMFAFRLHQLNALAEKTKSLNQPEPASDAVEWSLVRVLRDAPDEPNRMQGAARWQALAEKPPTSSTLIEARFALIDSLLADKQWSRARQLLEPLSKLSDLDVAARADERLAELSKPHLEVQAPALTRPLESSEVTFQARNLDQVTLTIRALNLADWLTQQQGRVELDKLPVTGSLQAENTFEKPATASEDGWTALDSSAMRLPGSTGHFVLRALGKLAQNEMDFRGEMDLRSLHQVSALDASLTTGRRRATLWMPDLQPGQSGQLSFWMHGSFVPTRIPITQPVTTFDLPGEAQVFRDKRWAALVEIGSDSLLLQGHLPLTGSQDGLDQMLITGSPQDPRVGEVFHLAGRLISAGPIDPSPLTVRFVTSTSHLSHSIKVTPAANGVFSADWTLPVELAGQPVRVLVQRDRTAIPPAGNPYIFRPQPIQQAPLLLYYLSNPYVTTVEGALDAWQAARYPWDSDAETAQLQTEASLDIFILPSQQHGPWSFAVGPYGVHGHSAHAHGAETQLLRPEPTFPDEHPLAAIEPTHVEADLASIGLTTGPLGIQYSVIGYGWDERSQRITESVMLGDANWQAWLAPAEAGPLQVGKPLRLRLNWFDPAGETQLIDQQVLITSAGETVAELPIHAHRGAFETEPWSPLLEGTYVARVTVSRGVDNPVEVSLEFRVARQTDTDARQQINVSARLDDWETPPVVRIELDRPATESLLAILLDQDLRAAQSFKPDQRSISIPIDPQQLTPRAVVILEETTEGLVEIGRTPLRQAAADRPRVVLDVSREPQLPGGQLPVSISVSDPGTVLVQITSREGRKVSADRNGPSGVIDHPVIAARSASGGIKTSAELRQAEPHPDLLAPWNEQSPDWHRLIELESDAEFPLPLPQQPGIYDVQAHLMTGAGWVASTSRPLTIDAPLDVGIDIPDRMLSGDRIALAVHLRNRTAEAQRGKLTLWSESGLKLEGSPVLEFELAPEGEQIARFAAEAATPGLTTLGVDIQVGELSWRHSRTATVLKPDVSVDLRLAQVSVERQILMLQEDMSKNDTNFPGIPTSRWSEVHIPPDAAIPLGTRLLIRDKVSPRNPLRGLTWQQQLGGNICTVENDYTELSGPGDKSQRTMDRIWAQIERIAEPTVIETIVVTTRPGVSTLPPPRFEQRDGYVPVCQLTEPLLIRVVE
jgi:hypothetical protein